MTNGAGPALRGHIVIATQSKPRRGEARAAIEDDFHHFRVAIRHTDGVVVQASGQALRNPHTACPLSAHELTRLVGPDQSMVSSQVYRQTHARLQCTQMLDLAGLAIAAAARGISRHSYNASVPEVAGLTQPTLSRDGAPR